MNWVLGLIGAVIGAALAEGAGAVAGFAIGWLLGADSKLRTRIDGLERQLASRSTLPRTEMPIPERAPTPAPEVVPAAAPPRATAPIEPGAAAAPPIEPIAARAGEALAAARAAAATATATTTWAAREPEAPRAPDLGERVVGLVKRWFTEGNVPVKLGILVLFFGVAAALKYAVDQRYFSLPTELWLALVAAAALVGLAFGWRQRARKPVFALSLQGGAIGVLLLTVFAAYRRYHLVPAEMTFALVAIVVAGAALLAVLQSAVALAVLGFTGGYLAPVLISTGSGNHVALFTYYAVLNAAVFAIAWVRPWRALNLIGFAFTFAIGAIWGAKYYDASHFATVEPFLVLFFAFYLAIPVLYARREQEGGRGFVDGTLVFGMPLLAFPLQAALLEGDRMGLAYSALVVAAVYGLLTWWLIRRPATKLLGQSFAMLALGFATLAVPLALSARWTATTWAIEGVALVWLGLRQSRLLPQAIGMALQLAAAVAFVVALFDYRYGASDDELVLLNGEFLSAAILAFSGFTTSFLYDRAARHRVLVWLPFLGGAFWWLVAGAFEVERLEPGIEAVVSLLVFLGVSAALAAALRRPLAWPMLGWPIVAVALAGVPLAFAADDELARPLANGGALAWAVWLAASLGGLVALRDDVGRRLAVAHIALFATVAAVLGLELDELARLGETPLAEGWRVPALALPLALLLALTWRTRAARWPLAERYEEYAKAWYSLATATLALWWTVALGSAGDPAPLPYVPLVNPLELAQLAVLALLAMLARDALALERRTEAVLAGAAVFAFVTVASLRAVHHVTGLPWSDALLDSRVAQAVLTITWSALGVVAWVYGSKRGQRGVWLAGAALMGVVLAKLLLLDRQYIGNLAGIVTFLAVGLLLTAVGWFAPSPPRDPSTEPAS